MTHTKLLSEAAELRRLGYSEEQIVIRLKEVNLNFRCEKSDDELKALAAWAVRTITPSRNNEQEEVKLK